MGFFWKYTRSGMYSQTYISFIIDVLPSSIFREKGDYYWKTSFEELKAFLVLLQDVEVINNPSVGILKPDYAKYIRELRYEPTSEYKISGEEYRLGYAVMGRHDGKPLPWGFVSDLRTPMIVKVTGLKYSAFPNAENGLIPYSREDKLQTFRSHYKFENAGVYWDYMPFHSCIIPFIKAMNSKSISSTSWFIENILKWK